MTTTMRTILAAAASLAALTIGADALNGQERGSPGPNPPTVAPPQEQPVLRELVAAVSPGRIEADIRSLVSFGTRHTLSDTLSETRGIGAARRWIKA